MICVYLWKISLQWHSKLLIMEVVLRPSAHPAQFVPKWHSIQTFCHEAKIFFISRILPFREDTTNSFRTTHSL